ncbi:hypothetical protein BAUCODRAFT_30791 [Baudoinia panamericana UAMH 10762]|uniref:Fe2OG dioxygenase domain-containing protein n=1 Tax=Baudoinia panamericana (strain UAMH 10762) TaxID=717646 RepID=M2M003_BAUPA|nr:uncharacterized protein BAUCODRAFT_30791 [Baudoinia panamericana UAMH 10762]EMD00308.1 hypothetical protein BAUCODRAFT_30791 [Baudoinia panamericana UAMH 10762]
MSDITTVLGPDEPPPLLTPEQITHLAYHGWLPLTLPVHLNDAVTRLSQAARAFFDQHVSLKRSQYPARRGTECGFYECPGEKEYLTIRYDTNATSYLEECARLLWRDAANYLHRVLCDISRAGEYNVHAWSSLVKHGLELPADDSSLDTVTSLLRMFRYLPDSGVAAQHVDNGLLTLCVGEGQGLQVLDRSIATPPTWVDVDGPVVLVGDLTRALLRNRVRAGVHRVVGNPCGRSSLVFALRPYLKGIIDLAAFGGKGLVDTRDYCTAVKGSKVNVNAAREVREQQQKDREHSSCASASGTNGFG